MKKFSKILSVALLVALVLSLGVANAFAAGEGKITVANSENGTTYNFYRILDLTGVDTNDPADGTYDAVTYTMNSKWTPFFSGSAAGASYLVDTNSGSLNAINFNGAVKYINITESNIVAFTNAAMDYAIENGIAADATKSGTGSAIEITDLDLGYYLMVPDDASLLTDASSGSIASLTSTVPEATMQLKAVKPGIEKVDDTISADIGKVVTYTVTGKVPSMAGYDTYKYIIKDEMTDGLTFKQDVVAKIGEKTLTTTGNNAEVTITYNGNTFSADFNVAALQSYVGQTITLTYTAVVNDKAVSNTTKQEKNKVHLEYGHNPSDLEETTPIEEEVYSAKVVINKYTGDKDTGEKLAGAQFALMKIVDGAAMYYKYTAATGTADAKVDWVAVAGAPADGTSAVTDAMAKALADATTITTVTTDSNGAGEFPGLADGTYYLVEFAAPTGYNRLSTPLSVTVAGEDADTATGKVENKADATNQFDTKPDGGVKADVENNSGTTLPSTGGIGTTIFYVVGGVLVLAAIILLVTKKRMSE